MKSLYGRDFLTLLDFTPAEITYLLELAARLKAEKKAGIPHKMPGDKCIALIFEKTSTRTRCAFEVAAHDLGMGSTYLDPTVSQIGKKESIADTARVLSGMFSAIEYRGFGQEIVNELAEYADIPVINGLTNDFHPTQVLADLLTVKEHFGTLENVKLVYMGDACYNMGNSLMVGCAKMGMRFTVCAPKQFYPKQELIDTCTAIAAETGAVLEFTEDPAEAVRGAHVIYTDIWVSMGEPVDMWETRVKLFLPYQVNMPLMEAAGPQAVFMHCLPSFHDLKTTMGKELGERYGFANGLEVTDEVFQCARSLVFQEAENRLHTIKAVIKALLTEDPLAAD